MTDTIHPAPAELNAGQFEAALYALWSDERCMRPTTMFVSFEMLEFFTRSTMTKRQFRRWRGRMRAERRAATRHPSA